MQPFFFIASVTVGSRLSALDRPGASGLRWILALQLLLGLFHSKGQVRSGQVRSGLRIRLSDSFPAYTD